MTFGPIGRGWSERLKYAGTYDDDWLENVFPFLPAYYQAAPADQQLLYLKGGGRSFSNISHPRAGLTSDCRCLMFP